MGEGDRDRDKESRVAFSFFGVIQGLCQVDYLSAANLEIPD